MGAAGPSLALVSRRAESSGASANHSKGLPDAYMPLSMRALQAVALVAFAHWTRAVGWQDEEVYSLREHLWSWMTVDAQAFDDWSAYDSTLLRVALGDEVAADLLEHWTDLGLDSALAVAMLQGVVEITYGSLFAAADVEGAHRDLRRVLTVADAAGSYVPPAQNFDSSLAAGDDAWGSPTEAEVARWRALEGE